MIKKGVSGLKFYMPARVFSENDCVNAHSRELASLGNHALIVTGKSSSSKNGSLDDVISALNKHGVGHTVFDGTEENPSVETVMKARDIGLEAKADFVIGVGGGSPLDAAKAAALMIANPEQSWEYMYRSASTKALPVAAVPTTCGTGSEVTGVAVITRHDLKTKVSVKHRIFPALALIDGKYILSAPMKLIANTAVDAFSHLIESGANRNADRQSFMLVKSGLELWKECRPYIEGKLQPDAKAAMKLMEVSAMAGMAIAQTGTTVPHALSYMLTYEAGIPHGTAVGIFLANYLRYADRSLRDSLLSAAGFSDADDLDDFIRALLPVAVSRDLLERSAESVLMKPEKLAVCPYTLDKETMFKLIDI